MNFVKRKANTKAELAVADFIELKSQFISDIRTFIKDLEEVPDYLLLNNWDQTAINMSQWLSGPWRSRDQRKSKFQG